MNRKSSTMQTKALQLIVAGAVLFILTSSVVTGTRDEFLGRAFDYALPASLLARSVGHTQDHTPAAGPKARPELFYDRENLQFQIKVVYAAAQDDDAMGLRGNGLGLSLEKSTPLTKIDPTTWTLNITYSESAEGATCPDATPCSYLPSGSKLVFRAVLDRNGVETVMRGYNYELQFPLSMVSEAFPAENEPRFTVHPWFFAEKGEITNVVVDSVDPEIGSRRMEVYLPPSFSENPAPAYDVMFGFDLNQDNLPQAFAPLFDYVFAETGTAKEAVVIGHGDYVTVEDRTDLLTPTLGVMWDCAEGDFLNNCNGCLDTSSPEAVMNSLFFGGCGIVFPAGGKGDQCLDFLVNEAFPKVNELVTTRAAGNSQLTQDRDRTMIMGYSLGGLMSCHALWTMPEVFGRGACQSASLWWPVTIDYETETWQSDFNFLNNTLLTERDNRPPQSILLDVGATEEDPKYHMQLAEQIVYESLGTLDGFEANRNLWFHSYPGEGHSMTSWEGRMWSTLNVLSTGRAYP